VPHEPTFPVSIKGVVVLDGSVLLLKNDRDEWELPGGRIEVGETPEQCVVREVAEETGVPVTAGPNLDSWMYYIASADKHVFVATYGCRPIGHTVPTVSDEHRELALFTPGQVEWLPMPAGYQRSIRTWLGLLDRP
jgi:8-oxo-dGTP pyrophosphatase MutT (NUDIX family)